AHPRREAQDRPPEEEAERGLSVRHVAAFKTGMAGIRCVARFSLTLANPQVSCLCNIEQADEVSTAALSRFQHLTCRPKTTLCWPPPAALSEHREPRKPRRKGR